MAVDESRYPVAYINPFMDILYEWGYAEGLWEDKRELLDILDNSDEPPESLKFFLVENDIPEWYYKDGWGMGIGAGNFHHILEAWEQDAPHQYGHYYGGLEPDVGNYALKKIGDTRVLIERWGGNIPCVGIFKGDEGRLGSWWYNPIIFTPTPGKSWFGKTKPRLTFPLLNWKETPLDSIK
jgi:hypothetical protein